MTYLVYCAMITSFCGALMWAKHMLFVSVKHGIGFSFTLSMRQCPKHHALREICVQQYKILVQAMGASSMAVPSFLYNHLHILHVVMSGRRLLLDPF